MMYFNDPAVLPTSFTPSLGRLSFLTSYFPMLLKKHMLTDPIIFEIIISQNQHN